MDSIAFLSLKDSEPGLIAGVQNVGFETVESALCFLRTDNVIFEGQGEKSEIFDSVGRAQVIHGFLENEC